MRRLAAIGTLTAVVIGVATSAGLVWNASYSAFSAQTTTPTNNWTAGTVALTNGQTGSALWTVTGLKPGYTDAKCVTVTSSGNLPSAVRMYTTAGTYSATNGVGPYVDIRVDLGSGTAGGTSCSGFTSEVILSNTQLSFWGASRTTYASGAGSWTTTGGATESKVYKVAITFNPGGLTQAQVDALQGAAASIGFTWEAQNT